MTTRSALKNIPDQDEKTNDLTRFKIILIGQQRLVRSKKQIVCVFDKWNVRFTSNLIVRFVN